MNTAEVLLDLQELDLERARVEAKLKDLLALKELSRKRAAYKKLKSEHAQLSARRKDLEFELEDLERAQHETEMRVTEAQHDAHVLKDYRQIQELEIELSDLAKQLDKLAFDQEAKRNQIAEAREREDYLAGYVAKFEKSLLHDAQEVRDAAQKLKTELSDIVARRDRRASRLDEGLLKCYEAVRTAKGGLAVERLEGAVPSVCRMALTESSLADLSRAGTIAECPYCHRILITGEGDDHDA